MEDRMKLWNISKMDVVELAPEMRREKLQAMAKYGFCGGVCTEQRVDCPLRSKCRDGRADMWGPKAHEVKAWAEESLLDMEMEGAIGG